MAIRADVALRDICEQYPQIRSADIELFCPAYYPIARIETDLTEKTFEDFEIIQESVLRMISLGLRSASVIAAMMGLKEGYVLQMMKLLLSYGHIDEKGQVTPLGKESLEQGRKAVEAHVKQIFLMDALNCAIVRLSKDLDRTLIERPDPLAAKNYAPFLDHAAGTNRAEIEKILKESNYKTLKRFPGSINVNVTHIRDVQCLDVRYVKSYLLKLRGRAPMVFVKRFDPRRKGGERYCWMPFSVAGGDDRVFLGIADLPVHTSDAAAMIDHFYSKIKTFTDASRHDNMERYHLGATLKARYGIEEKTEIRDATVTVRAEAFQRYDRRMLHLLHAFGKEKSCAVVDDRWLGVVFHLVPENDSSLLSCAVLVAKWASKHQDPRLQSLKDHIDRYIKNRIAGDEPAEPPLKTVTRVIMKQMQEAP